MDAYIHKHVYIHPLDARDDGTGASVEIGNSNNTKLYCHMVVTNRMDVCIVIINNHSNNINHDNTDDNNMNNNTHINDFNDNDDNDTNATHNTNNTKNDNDNDIIIVIIMIIIIIIISPPPAQVFSSLSRNFKQRIGFTL